MPAEPVSRVTAPAVRYLVDDGFVVGEVERSPIGFRVTTARGLRLGTYPTEYEAVVAAIAHRRARRAGS